MKYGQKTAVLDLSLIHISAEAEATPSISVRIVFTTSFFLYSLPSTKTELSFKEMMSKAVSFKVALPCGFVYHIVPVWYEADHKQYDYLYHHHYLTPVDALCLLISMPDSL